MRGLGPRHGLLALALAFTGWTALRAGPGAVADQMWDAAMLDKGERFSDPLWVDVAAAQARVSPLQPGWSRARSRLDRIARGRRAALADARGARRLGSVDGDAR